MDVTEQRSRRTSRGLTQRALAALADVPQPNIAAYETGRRRPDRATLARLDRALRPSSLADVRARRADLLHLAEARRLTNLRVFGSVARGEEGPDSDLDLLVTPLPGASLFDLAGFREEVSDALGLAVDVVSDGGSGPILERIRTEAVPL